MRKPVIAGNWKMNLTMHESGMLIQHLLTTCNSEVVEVIVCPPFTVLASVATFLRQSHIRLGAQDLFWEPFGAFTGEISAPMLVDAGCRYVIIGHSERRQHCGESDQIVQRKVEAAIKHTLTPILCVGETLADREANRTLDGLKRQLDGAMQGRTAVECGRIIVAYEPVWAIGPGRNATPEQAQEVHAFIRQWITSQYGVEVGYGVRILYGGSVTPANAAGLLLQSDVDGALVGGASLKADMFAGIVQAAIETKTATKSPVRSS